MSGITLLVPSFCLTAGGNLCLCQYRALEILKRPLATLWQTFMVDHHFGPVPTSLLSPACWFPQFAPWAVWHICVDHIQLWAVVACKLPSQTKEVIVPINNRPVIIKNIVQLSGFGRVLRGGDNENHWSVTRRNVKSPTPCSWEQQSYPWVTWASIGDNCIKKDRALLCIMRWKSYPSASTIRVGLIRRTGRCVFVRMVQRCLAVAGYRSRHPARCPSLTLDHRRRRHKLAHRHQNWNHQH